MPNEEKRKIYQQLAAPFREHCIQRTEGRLTGRGYDTVGYGYQHAANRLNEVLGVGGWRAHRTVVVKEIVRADGRPAFEAICDIILELCEWIDGQFIVFAESLADGGHLASSEADARKGAYTSAFKKAAAFFGVGRQAYVGSLDDDNLPGEQVVQTDQQPVQRPASAAAPVAAPHVPVQQQPRPAPEPPTGHLYLGGKRTSLLGFDRQAVCLSCSHGHLRGPVLRSLGRPTCPVGHVPRALT